MTGYLVPVEGANKLKIRPEPEWIRYLWAYLDPTVPAKLTSVLDSANIPVHVYVGKMRANGKFHLWFKTQLESLPVLPREETILVLKRVMQRLQELMEAADIDVSKVAFKEFREYVDRYGILLGLKSEEIKPQVKANVLINQTFNMASVMKAVEELDVDGVLEADVPERGESEEAGQLCGAVQE